jgi:hypothetical protein
MAVTAKLRLPLGREGLVGAAEVGGLHAPGLRLRLQVDRLVDGDVPFGVELALGDRVGGGRTTGQAAGELGGGGQRIGGETVPEAPALAFLRAHGPAGEQQLGGAAMADDPRQHGARTHIGARQADAGEQERRPGLGRRDAEVAGHRQDRARAGADAFHGGDDRLRAGAHGFHQVAGHAGEVEQPALVHAGQRTDDLVHVAARAEVAARAPQHHDLDRAGELQRAEQVAQLVVAVEGQRVLPLRPVEGDGRHPRVEAPQEVGRLQRGRIEAHAVVPPSTVTQAPVTERASGWQR